MNKIKQVGVLAASIIGLWGCGSDTAEPYVAWVGENDTEVIAPDKADGYSFIRSTDENCDIKNHISCENGALDIVSANSVLDSTFTLNQPASYWLTKDSVTSRRADVSVDRFSARSPKTVVFKDKLWVVGGYARYGTSEGDFYAYNDVWSSSDGISWSQLSSQLNLSVDNIVVFNDKLWIFDTQEKHQIWSSIDGVDWVAQNDSPEFTRRPDYQLIRFKDKLWLYAMSTSWTGQEAWFSSDGVNWSRSEASYPSRTGAKFTEFNSKLWMIGGFNSSSGHYHNDIWSSSDGIKWSRTLLRAPFGERQQHEVFAYNNRLWVIGGLGVSFGSDKNDVWSSLDGVIWSKVTGNSEFFARSGHTVEVFNNRLWLIGGHSSNYSPNNEVWNSQDGKTWRFVSTDTNLGARKGHQVISFKDKFWLIGGSSYTYGRNFGETKKSDVWSSFDGLNWNLETDIPGFSPRDEHQVVNFDGKLWIIGGLNDGIRDSLYFSGVLASDVWSTYDGVQWTKVSSNIPARFGHQITDFNNKLWLIGGKDVDGIIHEDIWFSTDGMNWSEVKTDAPPEARFSHQVTPFNGKLWLVGGIGAGSGIWSSIDGISWVEEVERTPFISRIHHQLEVFDNKLWVISGEYQVSEYEDEYSVWSSSDGINWYKEDSAPFIDRKDHQVAVLKNKMIVVGGMTLDQRHRRSIVLSDVWSTEDGKNWRKGFRGEFFFPANR